MIISHVIKIIRIPCVPIAVHPSCYYVNSPLPEVNLPSRQISASLASSSLSTLLTGD